MANTAYQSAYTGTQIDTAIGDVNSNTINGSSLTTSASYWFGTSSTAAATVQKEVSIPSIKVLNAGQIIVVKPTVTSTVANSTLKLNSFDAYPMRYNNAAITTSTDSIVWSASYPSIWLFDGTYWVFLAHGVDTNTTYSAMSVSEGTTGTATSARTMRADYLKQIIETLAPQSDWEEDDSTDPAYIKNKPAIPSKTSDLTNDSGFITGYTETDPVFTASAAHGISSSDISNWNAKGTYSKPSGGIPKTDLASAVQTSLGKADTALQSYTETDPVFAASAAHGITSSDISNWNSKTSNIGTITGINMNGASKGTSGVVDLGTVITAHQDISGKADKATTLAGYGITDAYTKTEVGDRYYAIWGAIVINASSTNTIDLNDLTTSGNYNCTTGNSQYVLNKPVSDNKAFRIVVMASTNGDTAYERQRFQIYNEKNVYERYSSGTVGSWSNWVKVQGDLDDIVSSTITTSGAASFGSTLNVTGKATMGAGLNITGSTDAYSQGIRLHDAGDLTSIWMRCANATGNDAGMVGITADSTGLHFRLGANNTATSYTDYVNILYGGNVGIGNTSPSYKLDVSGTLNATGAATLGSTLNVTGNTTLSGHLYVANNKAILWKDSGGTNREILGVSSSNNLNIGYSAPAAGSNTYIHGSSISFRIGGAGSSTYNALSINSSKKATFSGDVDITGSLSFNGTAVVKVFSGSSAPSSNTGSDGDIYIQTS